MKYYIFKIDLRTATTVQTPLFEEDELKALQVCNSLNKDAAHYGYVYFAQKL